MDCDSIFLYAILFCLCLGLVGIFLMPEFKQFKMGLRDDLWQHRASKTDEKLKKIKTEAREVLAKERRKEFKCVK